MENEVKKVFNIFTLFKLISVVAFCIGIAIFIYAFVSKQAQNDQTMMIGIIFVIGIPIIVVSGITYFAMSYFDKIYNKKYYENKVK